MWWLYVILGTINLVCALEAWRTVEVWNSFLAGGLFVWALWAIDKKSGGGWRDGG